MRPAVLAVSVGARAAHQGKLTVVGGLLLQESAEGRSRLKHGTTRGSATQQWVSSSLGHASVTTARPPKRVLRKHRECGNYGQPGSGPAHIAPHAAIL